MRKSESEREPSFGSPVRASANATLLSVALENHLNPFRVYFEPGEVGGVLYGEPAGVANVSVCETSEPPGR